MTDKKPKSNFSFHIILASLNLLNFLLFYKEKYKRYNTIHTKKLLIHALLHPSTLLLGIS